MNDTLQAVEYRRLVASIASQLSPEEVERILFIRSLKPDSLQVNDQHSDSGGPTALHTLAALERKGEFSLQNLDGLAEIAKDVNRHDLIRLIDAYKKTRLVLAKKPLKILRTPKLLRKNLAASSTSKSRERSHLEATYEMMVTRFTFLEQQMSLVPRLLEGEGDLQDEGIVILTSLKCAASELAERLTQAHDCFLELSGDGGSLYGSFEDLTKEASSENKQSPLSPLAEAIYDRPTVRPQQAEAIYDRPTLPATPAQNSKLLVRPPIAMVSQRRSMLGDIREGTGYAKPGEDDQDFTGDSGFGTSSKYFDDPDPYCVVDLWKRQHPPPPNRLSIKKRTKEDRGYMPVCQAKMNSDPAYDIVRTPSKT